MNALTERYFRTAPGAGSLQGPPGAIVRGEAGREADGARVRFHLRVAGDRVIEARFQAYGCPHTIAAAAWLTEQLPGRSRQRLVPGTPLEWAAKLEAPAEKLGRLLIVEDALLAALRAWPAGP